MSSEARWKSLALVLSGLLLGAFFVQPTLSIAQDAPAATSGECKRWEVTQWSPGEDGECKFKGRSPYSHRGEWCPAPEGADVIDALNAGESGDLYRFWVKRCVSR
jgi:hypothetical protein